MAQETIQALFWPESPTARVRSKLDNLLSRLRKTLDKAFHPHTAKNYLVLQKGVLRLQNCRIDALRFAELGKRGSRHHDKSEFWQAGNVWHCAHRLFKGEFMPGVYLHGQAALFREALTQQYLKTIRKRVQLLSQNAQIDEAIRIAEKAIVFDPTDETLVKALYTLLIRAGQTLKARKTVQRYQNALAQDDCTQAEIDAIMDAFWSE